MIKLVHATKSLNTLKTKTKTVWKVSSKLETGKQSKNVGILCNNQQRVSKHKYYKCHCWVLTLAQEEKL